MRVRSVPGRRSLVVVLSIALVAAAAGVVVASRDVGRSALAADVTRPAASPSSPGERFTATAPPLILREITVAADAEAPALRRSPLTPVPPQSTKTASVGHESATGAKASKRGAGSSSGATPAATGRARATPRASCQVPGGVRASQVVVVRSAGSRATVRACSRSANGSYRTDLGPFSGYVGRSGVTSATAKREGDGATPAGVYPLRGGFGLKGNPGIPQGWFRVDSRDVWVDDPKSSLYNTHQREPVDGRWSSAESLANPPAYDYAQVIGYNESRRPGRGSAIFLHVSTGRPTAGCVSLPRSVLLEVMRWERSGAVIAIS